MSYIVRAPACAQILLRLRVGHDCGSDLLDVQGRLRLLARCRLGKYFSRFQKDKTIEVGRNGFRDSNGRSINDMLPSLCLPEMYGSMRAFVDEMKDRLVPYLMYGQALYQYRSPRIKTLECTPLSRSKQMTPSSRRQ